MNTRKVIDITIKGAYFLITAALCLLMCKYLYKYVVYIIDMTGGTPNILAALSFCVFVAHTIVSVLISFYNKKYSKISFILALVSLALSVVFYNHICIFQPDVYPTVQY